MNKLKQLSSWAAKKLRVGWAYLPNKGKQTAFTLAEVLITITIIGVVAAMTIPNLLSDVNQRKYNSVSGNFQRKLGEALRVMNGQNTLRGYNDTKDFVAELGKNIKILKVCDKVEDCFPAKFRKSDDTFLESSTLKDSTALGRSKYGTKTVGVQFMNGVRAIIAYNPFYTLQDNGEIVKFTKDTENKTVKMTTDVISMLFDVSEDDNNKLGEDILQLNMSLGGAESELVQVGPYKIKIIGTDYTYVDCSSTTRTTETTNYCGKGTMAKDYWAGARKACDEQGMTLPDKDKLKEIYDAGMISGGTPRSNWYYSSSEDSPSHVYYLDFSSGSIYLHNARHTQYNILCVAN